MTNKQIFFKEIEKLAIEDIFSEAALKGLEELQNSNEPTSLLTENGAKILRYLQENNTTLTAAKIAEGLGVKSRSVSGSMRKLVQAGFVEKFSGDPTSYKLTSLGKELNIDEMIKSVD